MSLIGALVGFVLTASSWRRSRACCWTWTGVVAWWSPWVARARTFTHAWTEPVLAPVRRRIRPVRLGGISLDLAFTIVFLASPHPEVDRLQLVAAPYAEDRPRFRLCVQPNRRDPANG